MADDRDDLLRRGEDYELDRWALRDSANPDNLARDPEGNVIWFEGDVPSDMWPKVGMVTINYDPGGEGKFRNIPISPDEPLDPYGEPDHAYDPDYFYDLDDLASQYDWSEWSP